jgi:translocator protein
VLATQTTNRNRHWAGLIAWLALCLAVELSGVTFLPGRWYAHLHKAPWTPPSYLFAPIWTVMYVLMAIAAWLVWSEGGFRKHRLPLSLFLLQLALNGAWSFICFRLHDLPLSVADMTLLWVVVAVCAALFFGIKPAAGWLMLAYLLWVSFAASLNIALWRLNS